MHNLIKSQFPFWISFFLLALLFGTLFAAQLLGFTWFNETLLEPATTRSLHISLMLYGPVMLILSLLPFALFHKDKLDLSVAVPFLQRYFLLWNFFLFALLITLLFGLQRNLAFYDYIYELNFLLAFAGVFYIIAVLKTASQYAQPPLWVKVSKAILFSAPLMLLFLMNPEFGQVEATVSGPHGDNTLGMSFALIPLYYLIIKLYAKENFRAKWHIFWTVPLAGYILSVSLRIFRGELSYNEEWIFQWLTFAYAPLLYIWLKDAGIRFKEHPYLILSIASFLFVMVEGNIIFIPEIRWLFHRNDLIVGHAHLAVGTGIFFMSLSVLSYFYKLPKRFAEFWTAVILIIFFALSVAGFSEAGLITLAVEPMWWLRMFAGLFATIGILYFALKILPFPGITPLALYHANGFLSDSGGGVLLLLFGPQIFDLLGFAFSPYYYIVFGFMSFVGALHFIGLYRSSVLMAELTSYARVITGTLFFTLYTAGELDALALLVASYDIAYALIYLIGMKKS